MEYASDERLAGFVRNDDSPNIILREDTFLELGSTAAGSCAFVLPTNQADKIHDGRITLIGPDIPESSGLSLPFAQVLLVGGDHIHEDDIESIREIQFIDGKIEGFMARSLFENMWCRVGKVAARKGFCFEILGSMIMDHAKQIHEKVQTVEAVFLTSSRDDLRFFNRINDQVRKINKEFRKEKWKIKGYDIECGLDCGTCADKSACDDIRAVLQEQRRKEEVSQQH
jgi:CO dehydrogenase/acetyl-CoA synthase beta subunit